MSREPEFRQTVICAARTQSQLSCITLRRVTMTRDLLKEEVGIRKIRICLQNLASITNPSYRNKMPRYLT